MTDGLNLEYQGYRGIMDDFSKSLRALRERTVRRTSARGNVHD
jgi:hypothetical protein